jgi:hypothetical protein
LKLRHTTALALMGWYLPAYLLPAKAALLKGLYGVGL